MNWNDVFRYDNNTGKLYWLVLPKCHRPDGEAGSKEKDGYVRVKFRQKHIPIHRIIWDMNNPKDMLEPGEEIDHINHVRDDNRLFNLRKVLKPENNKNLAISKANTSGVTGVCFVGSRNRWCAYIYVNSKRILVGYFKELSDAAEARKAAEVKYGFHENHGKKRG